MVWKRVIEKFGFAVFLASAAAGGCATDGLAWTRGPGQVGNVSIAMVGQACDRENDPNWTFADILDLRLDLQVRNSGHTSVEFDPRGARLLVRGESHQVHRSDAAATVAPWASRTFSVRFLERDDRLSCNQPMALDLQGAMRIAGAAVRLAPVEFVAARDDR